MLIGFPPVWPRRRRTATFADPKQRCTAIQGQCVYSRIMQFDEINEPESINIAFPRNCGDTLRTGEGGGQWGGSGGTGQKQSSARSQLVYRPVVGRNVDIVAGRVIIIYYQVPLRVPYTKRTRIGGGQPTLKLTRQFFFFFSHRFGGGKTATPSPRTS